MKTNKRKRRMAAALTAPIRAGRKDVWGSPAEPKSTRAHLFNNDKTKCSHKVFQMTLTKTEDFTRHSHMIVGDTFHSDITTRWQRETQVFTYFLLLLVHLGGHIRLGNLIGGDISTPAKELNVKLMVFCFFSFCVPDVQGRQSQSLAILHIDYSYEFIMQFVLQCCQHIHKTHIKMCGTISNGVPLVWVTKPFSQNSQTIFPWEILGNQHEQSSNPPVFGAMLLQKTFR